jgi:hypothetical protein
MVTVFETNSFRVVQIYPYLNTDIQHPVPIHIWILKSYFYDVDVQSYSIRHLIRIQTEI